MAADKLRKAENAFLIFGQRNLSLIHSDVLPRMAR